MLLGHQRSPLKMLNGQAFVVTTTNPQLGGGFLKCSTTQWRQRRCQVANRHRILTMDASNGTIGKSDPDFDSDDKAVSFPMGYSPEVLDWCDTESNANVNIATRARNPTAQVGGAFVDVFRMSSPYIKAHRGRVFVIHLPGALMEEDLFESTMEDIALLNVVGIKIVVVLGPRVQIEQRLRAENIQSEFIGDVRVTDEAALGAIKGAVGYMQFEVEGRLSRGVINMPSQSRLSVVSGPFYSAKPLGVIGGDDYGFSGKVRKIDVEGIQRRLNQHDLVVLSNLGYSPSGQVFNCQSESVAAECAAQLNAEKLIFMSAGETIYDKRNGKQVPNLPLKYAQSFLERHCLNLPPYFRRYVYESVAALQGGVQRAHILNRFVDGVLLMEVFHRDGVGLMLSRDLYEGIRQASAKDVPGLIRLIRPLEELGILKQRTRRSIEKAIHDFLVLERDGMIIGCAALQCCEDRPFWAEMSCLVVHDLYRKSGKGDALLGYLERKAYATGIRHIYVMSTQSFHWFLERGFSEAKLGELPESKRKEYNFARKSKIFKKELQGNRAVDEAELLRNM